MGHCCGRTALAGRRRGAVKRQGGTHRRAGARTMATHKPPPGTPIARPRGSLAVVVLCACAVVRVLYAPRPPSSNGAPRARVLWKGKVKCCRCARTPVVHSQSIGRRVKESVCVRVCQTCRAPSIETTPPAKTLPPADDCGGSAPRARHAANARALVVAAGQRRMSHIPPCAVRCCGYAVNVRVRVMCAARSNVGAGRE